MVEEREREVEKGEENEQVRESDIERKRAKGTADCLHQLDNLQIKSDRQSRTYRHTDGHSALHAHIVQQVETDRQKNKKAGRHAYITITHTHVCPNLA